MIYAQILNGKVHWIFEDADSLETIYATKFNPNDIVIIDITNVSPQPQEDWTYDGTNFAAPIVNQAQQISSLNAQYLPQFQQLQQSYIAAQLSGNISPQASIQQSYQTLQGQYNQAMQAITGGAS